MKLDLVTSGIVSKTDCGAEDVYREKPHRDDGEFINQKSPLLFLIEMTVLSE